jgi:hypothetical protein
MIPDILKQCAGADREIAEFEKAVRNLYLDRVGFMRDSFYNEWCLGWWGGKVRVYREMKDCQLDEMPYPMKFAALAELPKLALWLVQGED